MTQTPYEYMQDAIDIVATSAHPTNKIAATLVGRDYNGEPYSLSRTNFWPQSIKSTIGTETKIGNSSGTIHAESACIIDAPRTKGAHIYVSDLPCPNCTKNIVEAGIEEIYIDHKGFEKDYAIRRGEHFTHMSLRMCTRAGIKVYRLFRKQQRLDIILERTENYAPPLENPALEERFETKITAHLFQHEIEEKYKYYGQMNFAAALAHRGNDQFIISAETQPILGYTRAQLIEDDKKYSVLLQPINRLIMTAARKGMVIDPNWLFSNRVPTSRELVNMIGAELNTLHIGNRLQSRDKYGQKGLEQLLKAKILSVK